MRFFARWFPVVCLIVLSPAAPAAVISNLGEPTIGFSSVSGLPIPASGWTAVKFSTGGGTWQLNSLTARFQDNSGLTPDGFVIEVRDSAGTNPGNSVLGSFSPAINITTESDYLFSPTGAISLGGLADYWLVARPTNPLANYGWAITMNPGDNGQSGWSLADDLAASPNSGASWLSVPAVPILSIDATLMAASVPEPSSLLMLSVVSGAVILRRRRSQAAGPETTK